MQHALALPRALPSGGCALLLARRPSRAGIDAPQRAYAGGGGKRPAAKRRKAAAPVLPVYEGEGSEYFIFARKAEERCVTACAVLWCRCILALSAGAQVDAAGGHGGGGGHAAGAGAGTAVRGSAAAACPTRSLTPSRAGRPATRRREVLKKSALMKYPTLAQRREDQAFELGWRLQRGRAPEGTRRAQYSHAASCAWC